MAKKYFYLFIFLLFSFSCSDDSIEITQPPVKTHRAVYQHGIATWYGPGFHNRTTSSGQKYDMNAFTAAHRTLPLGSVIRVKNTENNREVILLVNDRGPVNTKLILDLSKIAAANLDIIRKGSGKIEIEVLSSSDNPMQKIFDTYRNLGNS